LPPPPVMPTLPKVRSVAVNQFNSFQIQVTGKNVIFYNFAMAHLRTLPGVQSATPQQINPVGTSYILVQYKGDISQLAAALTGRGWTVEAAGSVVKIRSDGDKPPAIPPPPPVQPSSGQTAQATSNQAQPHP
jgi:hypothetical protein